jgi:hypothetical protein
MNTPFLINLISDSATPFDQGNAAGNLILEAGATASSPSRILKPSAAACPKYNGRHEYNRDCCRD